MPFNGNGSFSLVSGNPVVSGTVISSTVHNNTMSDIANNGLSNAITKDGQTTITQNIPFNNKRLTGLGSATALTDAIRLDQVQNGAFINLSSVAGTDTITATLTPTPSAYASGQVFIFEPANANTGATTINISSLGAKDIYLNGEALTGGELIAGEPTIIRYNGTQFDLLAISALAVKIDSTGLNTSATNVQQAIQGALIGRKNAIINGNFDIWQRGISQTAAGYGSDDRWVNQSSGSTKTHTRQPFTLGQTNVPNEPEFFSRTVVNSVAGVNNFVAKTQLIEGVRTFAGQKVTLSFHAKADAPKNIAVDFQQSFGTGGSPSAKVSAIGAQLVALTAGLQKYEITVDIPSIAGKALGTDKNDYLEVTFWFDAGSNFNTRAANLGQQSGTFDIAQVQLEKGSVATDFEQRPIGEELALCQRYYYKGQAAGSGSGHRYSVAGSAQMDGAAGSYPVTMRVQPTASIETPPTFNNCTLNGLVAAGTDGFVVRVDVIASGIFRATSGVYSFDAEL